MNPDPRPYRPNVGIALFDRRGRVLIARRIKDDGPEIIVSGHEWQMPQGGIDVGEDPEAAAKRELWEETGVTSVAVLGRLDDWLAYDFPPYLGPPHKLAAFRGQRQLWFAMRFLGEEAEIDLNRPAPGEEPEFSTWRWARLDAVPALVVPFKRAVYERVADAYRRFAEPTQECDGATAPPLPEGEGRLGGSRAG
jgi:putative (di)nucleoside polyphosphate hydrolase